MFVTLLCWIILGMLSGGVATKMIVGEGERVPMDILIGIVGALVGGWMFKSLGLVGMTRLNLWSFGSAVIGALAFLILWHAIRGGPRRTHHS